MGELVTGVVLSGVALLIYWLAYSKHHIFKPLLKIPAAGALLAVSTITALAYGTVLIVAWAVSKSI
jgi:hypothetical protein